MTRREWIGVSAAAALQVSAAPSSGRFIKSICSVIFAPGVPVDDYFAQAKNAGFAGVELRIGSDVPLDSSRETLMRIREAAEKAQVAIVSLWASEPLHANPLNSPSAEARQKGVQAIVRTCDIAHELGCGAILLYPGRLGSGARLDVGYETTWQRFTTELKRCLPAAEKNQVVLTMENVWNKFLVSPLDTRSFVDQFHSPWLQTHFDTGNVMQYGYPQDWILTLGPRVKRVHLKDYKLSDQAEQGHFVDLLKGDVDWKAVMSALVEVNYRGYLSPEIGYEAGQPDQLMTVSRATDRILTMA